MLDFTLPILDLFTLNDVAWYVHTYAELLSQLVMELD